MGDGEQWIVIPRWEDFQHRDAARTQVPPWIKAYTKLLSDDAFLGLSHHLRGVLLGLWLEYARSTRHLSDSTVGLSRRLGNRVTRADLHALNHAGFIDFSASKPASNHASTIASLEKRREENPLNPPSGMTAKPTPRRTSEPTHEQTHPHLCGIDGCTVRHATKHRLAEHRENVHGLIPVAAHANDDLDWLESVAPDDDDPFT